MNGRSLALTSVFCALPFLCACSGPRTGHDSVTAAPDDRRSVVVYTALDEMYARPVLDAFEAQSGIYVAAVYDTEASKTTGLVTRLLAEKNRPRADVFWNNEVAQTIVLKQKGILTPYASPAAAPIPAQFKDPDHFWAGFAARARVIIYNTQLLKTAPAGLADFVDPKWKGRSAIALPLFGTTATHAAALWALWGNARAEQFFTRLRANETAVLPGNAAVRDAVARGEYAFGLTDTDDANGAVEDGAPVKWIFPDQEGNGTLLLPNTVGLVAGAPHGPEGRRLIDFLLSAEVEAKLANLRSIQMPLKPGVRPPEQIPALKAIRTMPVSYDEIAQQMELSAAWLREEFLR